MCVMLNSTPHAAYIHILDFKIYMYATHNAHASCMHAHTVLRTHALIRTYLYIHLCKSCARAHDTCNGCVHNSSGSAV